MQLTIFNEIDFLPALKAFFRELNIPINYVDDKPTSAKKILQNTYKDNESFKLVNDVYVVGLVDDAAFKGNQSLAIDKIKSDYDGVLIFGVTLGNRSNNLLPTRSQLAEIARAFNREFCYTPVVVVFKYGEYLAFANTERLKYKDNREGEKAGKVTLLRDINIQQPHSGHQRILADLAIPKTGKDRVDSFAKLYQYWQKILDVNLLNKQFYQEVSAWYFHACKQVVFPKDAKNNQESLIRLITRLMFVWFLKEKGLVPDELFNQTDIQSILKSVEPQESTYYKAILQNLFFATLNTESKREFIKESSGGRNSQYMVHNVFRYKDYFQDPDGVIERYFVNIPFLNGGLFECLDTEPEKNQPETKKRIDGFSNSSKNVLSVPNELFFGGFQDVDLNADFGTSRKKYRVRGLLEIFKSYKFTIAENTPFEEDVALDPELLGQVFENLLAAYNPETQTTARKQTGSFYTPREIVNYMVDESLIAYFQEKLKGKKERFTETDFDERLRLLLNYQSSVNSFEDNSDVTLALIAAIDNCKILDPACGSGAFPMGILQKMVHILAKLDPRNFNWKQRQIDRLNQLIMDAENIEDEKTRTDTLTNLEAQKENLERAFARNGLDYGRKLFLIQNCIYGVDIQPIAVQIAKLRFFISLIIDQQEDQDQANRGILPLPNLETKFVAANSLIGVAKVQQLSIFDTQEIQGKQRRLERLRRDHFFAKSLETKRKKRQEDERLCQEIGEILRRNKSPNVDSLQSWKPYDQNASADFFDPEWMFGIKDGFDICIGNPPYVRIQELNKSQLEQVEYFKKNYISAKKGNYDIYVIFVEKGLSLLNSQGNLAFILPHKFFNAQYGEGLRGFIAKGKHLRKIVHFGDQQVFNSATTYTCLLFLGKYKSEKFDFLKIDDTSEWIKNNNEKISIGVFKANEASSLEWNFIIGNSASIFEKIAKQDHKLIDITKRIFQGLVTGADKIFILNNCGNNLFYSEQTNKTYKLESELLHPLCKGSINIKKYRIDGIEKSILFPYCIINGKAQLISEKNFMDLYPNTWAYLLENREVLEGREKGKWKHSNWYAFGRSQNLSEMEQKKILTPSIASSSSFCLDLASLYFVGSGGGGGGGYGIILKEDAELSYEYILGLLNSEVVDFYLKKISTPFRGGYYAYNRQYIEQLPIHIASQEEQKMIEKLVSYVLYLTEKLKDIPSHGKELKTSADDKLMLSYFEQIIDAAVMELYLPEELHAGDKYFMRHLLQENLPNIDKIKGDKMTELRQIFHRLFDKEHPIRNNIYFLGNLEIVKIIRGQA